MSPTRIIIFAKAPVAGQVKTRLIPALGAAGAARLAARMLERTALMAADAGLGPIEICAAPSVAHPAWSTLDLPSGLLWSEQGEGDLGARMARAAQRVLDGGQWPLLIGTDCPTMTAAHLQQAAVGLRDHDAAMIPSEDGGYVLLGLKRFHASLFELMPWSTAAVAGETLARATQLGWRLAMQSALRDIDEPHDLAGLPAELATLASEAGA